MNPWQVRRNLRLAENAWLAAALRSGAGMLLVFILDDALLSKFTKPAGLSIFRAAHAGSRYAPAGLTLGCTAWRPAY